MDNNNNSMDDEPVLNQQEAENPHRSRFMTLFNLLVDRDRIESQNNMERNLGSAERRRGRRKRDSSHIADDDGESFYDCSICLKVARQPVVTCCGHLFCWPCFHRVPKVDSVSKECRGQVSNGTVIPIYGNGNGGDNNESTEETVIPPRPKGKRIERSSRGRRRIVPDLLSPADVLRAISLEAQRREEVVNGILSFGRQRETTSDIGRLSECTALLSCLSSAAYSAARLMEDLETVLNSRDLGDQLRLATEPNRPTRH